jgi:hypothetical protein
MHRHDVICVEEPPAERLQEMLQGDLLMDDYLWSAEVEYPECSRRICLLLRKLYQNGKEIIQLEAFLENLLAIHSFFSQASGFKELQLE